MATKKPYIAPHIDSVTFRSEVGYAASGFDSGNPLQEFIELMSFDASSQSSRETERFGEHDLWRQSDPEQFWR